MVFMPPLFTKKFWKDIKNASGSVIVEADTLLQKMTSDENGKATFTVDLPLGQY